MSSIIDNHWMISLFFFVWGVRVARDQSGRAIDGVSTCPRLISRLLFFRCIFHPSKLPKARPCRCSIAWFKIREQIRFRFSHRWPCPPRESGRDSNYTFAAPFQDWPSSGTQIPIGQTRCRCRERKRVRTITRGHYSLLVQVSA